MIDREAFFEAVRDEPFEGKLTQSQVNGMTYLLNTWARHGFGLNNPKDGDMWLAYCLATVFYETDRQMVPIEEYGKGEGHSYGQPAGPYGNCYYGRGHVMLTHEENYQKGEVILKDSYQLDHPLHEYPHRMLEDEPSALILFDGSIKGWFTGLGLPEFFNTARHIEDPVNARKVINGLDKADLIAGYYRAFKSALEE